MECEEDFIDDRRGRLQDDIKEFYIQIYVNSHGRDYDWADNVLREDLDWRNSSVYFEATGGFGPEYRTSILQKTIGFLAYIKRNRIDLC